jgi:hypothetical protein
MIFSPLLIVAYATLLSQSAEAARSPYQPRRNVLGRQTNAGDSSSSKSGFVDPHRAPDIPANFTSPIANGGIAWADAFAKAQEIVGQMTIEEKVNVTSGFVSFHPVVLRFD